jgi:uracil-xanthine permease
MGFDPNVAIFFSGIGTIVFFICVRGRIPSYLGSSFSFIAVVAAATAYSGSGANPNVATALGGIIACGAVYAVIGLVVMAVGYKWVEWLMPPVITGAIVMVIGLNLAHVAVSDLSGVASWYVNPAAGQVNDLFLMTLGLLTTAAVLLVAAWAPGILRRLPILVGGVAGYVLYYIASNVLNLGGTPINFDKVGSAAWVGLPNFVAPKFDGNAITLIAPIAIVLVAENLGHIKAVAAMTGRNLDPYIGRGFLGDGIATMISGSGGGTGVTTYAENIGVMAVTKIYSSLVFLIAAVVAILMGLCPKFGQLIYTVPGPVIGGLAIVLFGLIATTGARIWVQNKVDFSETRNLVTVAAALTIGAGDLTLTSGQFSLSGIAMACFGAIIVYQVLGLVKVQETPGDAPSADL